MEILRVQNLTKNFGGLAAVSDVSFSVQPGEIKALIGPNGAGKTTVLNLISGFIRPTRGSIAFGGQELVGRRIHEIVRLGMARTFQNVNLFGKLTVLDNILAGFHLHTDHNALRCLVPVGPLARNQSDIQDEAVELARRTGIYSDLRKMAGQMPFGKQRVIEIARALATRPRMLLLDEPAAGLAPDESAALGQMLVDIARESGITILLVEHNMRLVMGISRAVVVMNFGEVIGDGTPTEVKASERVIEAYLGKSGAVRA